MILDLTAVRVQLHSPHAAVVNEWREAFGNQLQSPSAGYDTTFQANVVETFSPIPAPEIYRDDAQALSVHADREASCFWLRFHDGAQVAALPDETATITCQLLPSALGNGRLLDVTYTGLAPRLRRRNLFLVHAFAAAKNGRCVLLVGPSGSGKTTAGLSLLQQGWQLLGNDVIVLQARSEGIYALPTPGPVRVRASGGTLPVPPPTEAIRWARPLPVTTLCFPRVTPTMPSDLHPLPAAVGLARLMAESVDRWDVTAVPAHVACLRRLCRQTAVFSLQSGSDVAEWPRLLTG